MTGKKTNKNKGSQDSDEAVFNPPDQEGAPDDIRETVLLGYKIMTETQKYAGHYIGNDLVCINCHFDGGRSKDSIWGGRNLPRISLKKRLCGRFDLKNPGLF
ncbi:hypothetical protein [uncultured Desulfobacter sp.]|uniref:hypothetical protein n=1 Tax=uncultured Desulfobacter sp. TaxID=240139 RepID=UPI002AA632FD|nr:hypothetical protein [uncultured Desulfobacter sp.]